MAAPRPLVFKYKFYHLFVDVINSSMLSVIVGTEHDNIKLVDDDSTKGLWYWAKTEMLLTDADAESRFGERFATKGEREEIFKQFNVKFDKW